MKTKQWRRLVAVAPLSITVLMPGQLLAQKMKVGYWTSGFSLGFGAVMEQMKFAEKEGLNIEWVKFAEVNGPTRAIVSNAIDVAFAAPSTNSMGIAADGVPVKIVLATQVAEAQIVVSDGSPIKTMTDLKGKKVGMSPPGSATHAITTAILDQNFGIKANDYRIAPGNEAQLAQFLIQKEIDAGVLRSVTIAQMGDVKLRRLGGVEVGERARQPPPSCTTTISPKIRMQQPNSSPRRAMLCNMVRRTSHGSPRSCRKPRI